MWTLSNPSENTRRNLDNISHVVVHARPVLGAEYLTVPGAECHVVLGEEHLTAHSTEQQCDAFAAKHLQRVAAIRRDYHLTLEAEQFLK